MSLNSLRRVSEIPAALTLTGAFSYCDGFSA
jgi:hypothetical protein